VSDPEEKEAARPAARGEAAWKAHREAIDARNDNARREGHERQDAWNELRRRVKAAAELPGRR
jgi:hypothetical protein